MPTYDYECAACGHTFEHFQSMSSRRLRKCPDCGERKLERLFGAGAGVIFKGSGFYETDYKRAGESARKSEAARKSDAAAKNEGSSGDASASSKSGAAKSSDAKSGDAKSGGSKSSSSGD